MSKNFNIVVTKNPVSMLGFSNEWNITEQVEVLRESFSDLLASYIRYFKVHNISLEDKKNSLVNMFFLLVRANKKGLSCKTLSDVEIYRGKYLLGRDFLMEIYHE